MALAYCTAADLYSFGLPRGAVPNPGRLIVSVDAATDKLTLDVHGFDSDDPVQFRAEAGGTLPAPLAAGVTYYAIPVDESAFSVTTVPNGSAINLTTAGSRIVVIAPLPMLAATVWASRLIDDMLPAHMVPLTEPIHELVRMTAAELAAGKLLARAGVSSKSLADMVDAARKRLERWARGVPLRGEDAPPTANHATVATAAYADPRGWEKFGGL